MILNFNQHELKQLLTYDTITGIFKWKYAVSRNIHINDIAGYVGFDGYRKIGIKGKSYLAHRLAWFYVYGYFPENEIDHINRNRDDNRIKNLREVSIKCNRRNVDNLRNNTSGVKGVYFHQEKDKWLATITNNRKQRSLGYYDNFDDAVCARLAGEQCLDWFGCDDNSPAYRYVKKVIQS